MSKTAGIIFATVVLALVCWRASLDGTYAMEWDAKMQRYFVWKLHFVPMIDLVASGLTEAEALAGLDRYKKNPSWTKAVPE